MNAHWSTKLPRSACPEAVAWAKAQPSYAEAWASCERGDWMLWLAGRLAPKNSGARRAVVFAACQCARLALPRVAAGELRPLAAIEMAERWSRKDKNVTLAMVSAAAAAAAAAAAYAYAAAAAAAYAYAYAAAAAAAAAYAYARTSTLMTCADLVRQHVVPMPALEKP